MMAPWLAAPPSTSLGVLQSRDASPSLGDFWLQRRIRILPELDELEVVSHGALFVALLFPELAKPLVHRGQVSPVHSQPLHLILLLYVAGEQRERGIGVPGQVVHARDYWEKADYASHLIRLPVKTHGVLILLLARRDVSQDAQPDVLIERLALGLSHGIESVEHLARPIGASCQSICGCERFVRPVDGRDSVERMALERVVEKR